MASFRPKHIGQGKTPFMVGDVGSASIGGVKERTSEGQPQWQQWEWHKDKGGGGKRSSRIKGTIEAEAKEGHFEGEMFQLWQDGPLCIPVSCEEKGQG